MSNLSSKAKSSKLKTVAEKPKDSNKILEKKSKGYARSYRFDSEIKDILKEVLDNVNSISPKKISETRLIKALIIMGKKSNPEKVLQAAREVL